MVRRHRLAAAGIGVAILAVAGVAYALTRDPGPQEEIVYRYGTVDRGAIASEFSSTGTINAIGTVNILTQVSGEVIGVYADFNTPVTAGMVLARINPETFLANVQQAEADLLVARASLTSAKANVERAQSDIKGAEASRQALEAQRDNAQIAADAAQRELVRQRDLFERTVVTAVAVRDAETKASAAATQLDQVKANIIGQTATLDGRKSSLAIAQAGVANAEATIKQKEAALAEARNNLERTEIRALTDGVVIARNVEAGQFINTQATQQTPLFTVARDLREMDVNLSLDEADITKVKEGLPVTFSVDSYPGRTFLGRINQVRLSPKTNQNVVTYTVVARVNNPDQALFPGMTATATVVLTGRENALRIPSTALRFTPVGVKVGPLAPAVGGGRAARVFVEGTDGKPQVANITIGMADNRNTEVLAGDLKEGQRLIVGSNQPGATPGAGAAGGGGGFQQQIIIGGPGGGGGGGQQIFIAGPPGGFGG